MAIDCGRNDAAVFARVYNRVIQTGNESLFPEIAKPAGPIRVVKQSLEVKDVQASIKVPYAQMRFYGCNKELVERVIEKLSQNLFEEIRKSGAIKFSSQDAANGQNWVAVVKLVVPSKEG